MSIILRKRIFKKMAQAAPTPLPTNQQIASDVVSGSPPSFVATNWYPSIITAFQTKNTGLINRLSNLINDALFYASDGKVHLPWMRSVNFMFGVDQAPSIDLKNLMIFSKLLYNNIFTNLGQAYTQPLNTDQIKEKIDKLTQSTQFNNLTQTGASSQLSTKIGGNLKELIRNNLLQIR